MNNILPFILLICGAALGTAAQAQTLEVPGDYSTIQAAIDAAQNGDIVLIAPGTYNENIELRSNIVLRGQETARTFLRPGAENTVVQASNVEGVTIRNLTFIGGEAGINITNGFNIDISNNVFALGSSGRGIVISTLDSTVEILNNTFFGNQTAIDGSSSMATIQNNIFASNSTPLSGGIDVNDVSFNCFSNNPVGSDATTGDPDFVDTGERDFHLRAGSPCIDAGTGTETLDGSTADAGAYGGQFADTQPLSVAQPQASVSATNTPSVFNVAVSWPANPDYRVDGYRLYYDSDRSGSPYEGTDAEDAGGQAVSSPIDVGNVTSFTLHNLNAVSATPDTPVLQAASPSNQTIALRWLSAANASAYRVHYGIASLDENIINVGNVTSHEINGLENGNVYRLAVSALNQPAYYLAVTAIDNNAPQPNESVLSEERRVAVGEEQESPLSNEMTAIPEIVEPYPDLPDQGDRSCFIATAAYGHYATPQVQVLRDFRDAYLLKHPGGRAFVRWYYAWSPDAAAYISEHPLLKAIVAGVLLPLVGMAYFLVHLAPLAQLALLGFCCAPALLTIIHQFRYRTTTP